MVEGSGAKDFQDLNREKVKKKRVEKQFLNKKKIIKNLDFEIWEKLRKFFFLGNEAEKI